MIVDDEMDPEPSFSTSNPRFYDPENRFSLTGGGGGRGWAAEGEPWLYPKGDLDPKTRAARADPLWLGPA